MREERERLALQYEHLYGGKLYDRRLETYPRLYAITSRLAKKLRTTYTSSDLNDSTAALEKWDNDNALLVSPITSHVLIELRHQLWEHDSDSDLPAKLLETIARLESALRTEIGVFDSRGFHNPEVT